MKPRGFRSGRIRSHAEGKIGGTRRQFLRALWVRSVPKRARVRKVHADKGYSFGEFREELRKGKLVLRRGVVVRMKPHEKRKAKRDEA